MDDEYLQWRTWRAERELELLDPHSWLSLTSLTWLGPIPQMLPGFPGHWSAAGQGRSWVVTATFDEGDTVVRDGRPLTSRVIGIEVENGAEDTSLTVGDLLAEVAQRGAGVMVRIHDPHARTRTGFRGVPAFDVDSSWACPAAYSPFEQPHDIQVPSAQPGVHTRLSEAGRAVVTLPDHTTVDLEVTDLHGNLVVIFHDPTNGAQTAAWRRAPLLPDEGGWVVDFNRAQNFPAHFTPFGTCPTPPEGQSVPLAVHAGEKAPAEPVD